MVRRLVCGILEDAGYRVLQAANGREAFDIFSRSQQRIDLLISDVVMPEMGGGQLARIRGSNLSVSVENSSNRG